MRIVLLLAIVIFLFFVYAHAEVDKTSISNSLESRIIRDAGRKEKKKGKLIKGRKKKKGGKRKQQRKNLNKGKEKGKKRSRKFNKRKGNGLGKGIRKSKKGKDKKKGVKRIHNAQRPKSLRSLDDVCFKKAVEDLDKLSSFVANFIKQMKRVEKQTKVAGNKNEKSGIFPDVAALLVELGGGNIASLSCAGSTTSPGAKNLTDLVNNLLACEEDISKACSTDIPTYNQTYVEECNNIINNFTVATEECVNKASVDEACTCWKELDSKSVGGCKKIDEAESIKDAFEVCKKTFSKCKKYEDYSINIFSDCSGRLKDRIKKTVEFLNELFIDPSTGSTPQTPSPNPSSLHSPTTFISEAFQEGNEIYRQTITYDPVNKEAIITVPAHLDRIGISVVVGVETTTTVTDGSCYVESTPQV